MVGVPDVEAVQYSSRYVWRPYRAVSGRPTSRSSAVTSSLLSRRSGVRDSTRPWASRLHPAGWPTLAPARPVDQAVTPTAAATTVARAIGTSFARAVRAAGLLDTFIMARFP